LIKLWAVGGYSQIGRNMNAVIVDNEVVIFDIGYDMDKVVKYQNGDINKLPYQQMLKIKAIPNDKKFKKMYGKKVVAIVCGHAHLDHIGAIPLVAKGYKAPIIATPFTIQVIKNILEKRKIPNRLVPVNPSSTYKISRNLKLELVNVTHSTLQASICALHTKYGIVIYANDWKFDDYPILGKRTNYNRLKELGKKGVFLQISDTTRIDKEGHTPSEHVVREMMRDLLRRYDTKGNAIIVTTFSSHIARLHTIISIAKQMKRTPILLGRSLSNYMAAAELTGLYKTPEGVKVVGYKHEIAKYLGHIQKNRDKYLIICTGNQGEIDAVLSRISKNQFRGFKIQDGDMVVFSCFTIPTPANQANRKVLEARLKSRGARIFKEIHASGHASYEDQREMLKILKPKYYVPTHGGADKLKVAAKLAKEMGYKYNKNVFVLKDGMILTLQSIQKSMRDIKKWVLKNAVDYEGKAIIEAVIPKIIGEKPEIKQDLKKILPKIKEIIKKVNKMSLASQKRALKRMAPELLEEKKIEQGLPELPNVDRYEKIVMRLAPYPSGPLHIGNARMVILNNEYVKKYKGELILFYDDTIGTSSSETGTIKDIVPEAYDMIKEDLKWLRVDTHKIYYKSDRLEIYYKHCTNLLRRGNAYACKCSAGEFRTKYKSEGKPCPCRDQPIVKNLEIFDAMLKGRYKPGDVAIRLKTSMTFRDPAIRDHVIMRVSKKLHPRVKTKYKVWPTMEFSWGIDNHLLGITHVIRGKDLMKEAVIEKQIFDFFDWPHINYIHFGRFSMALSKSELQKLKRKIKMDYSDPRTWSLLSLKRRGIQPKAVVNFLLGFGLSLADIEGSPELLYAENKKIIDPKSNRYFFVTDPVSIEVTGYDVPYQGKAPIHPDFKRGFRNYKIEEKKINILMNKDDLLPINKEFRLKDLMNIQVKRKSPKTTARFTGNKIVQDMPKIHWVFDHEKVPTDIVMPNGETAKGFSEKEVSKLEPGTIIQNERFGFCRIDSINRKIVEYFTHK
jgi:glutamyl-tRNA synthetase